MDEKTCLSCKKRVVNDAGKVDFQCPKCKTYLIVRCSNCRSNAVKYSCPNCGFVGPN
ncbi:hypothetical protein J4437_04560 [Candidatus Woesearchaeota archaeon]|nr:hypothetical protein [Candidatus Woesearchaeota archaeon]